jgi:CRP-like cAMP-binding protein
MAGEATTRFVVHFEAGEHIFSEGDTGTEMYIIKAGRVGLWREVNGERTTLTVLSKGDFFGEMSLLEGSPRTATAEAVDPCDLMRIDGATFSNMVRQNVEIAVRMMRKLSARIRHMNERILELEGKSEKPKAVREDEPPAAEQSASLQIEDTARSIPLWKKETRIGRYDPVTGERPDVDLTDEAMGRSVSRRHARIVERGGEFYLVAEIGTLNATLVNGKPLDAATLTPLADGDEIGLGGVKILFQKG